MHRQRGAVDSIASPCSNVQAQEAVKGWHRYLLGGVEGSFQLCFVIAKEAGSFPNILQDSSFTSVLFTQTRCKTFHMIWMDHIWQTCHLEIAVLSIPFNPFQQRLCHFP